MNWFGENRFLRSFAVGFGVALLAALWFLFSAKGDFDEATARFTNTSTELNRLQRLAPFPSDENLRKMKAHAEDYSSALAKLKEELKTRVAPAPLLKPNEFQSQLRIAVNAAADKARANKVKLPDKFYLGFDDFVAALPNESAAPLLGQELGQVEWLVNALLDAHVDAITTFRRTPLPEERGNPPGVKSAPATTVKSPERNGIEIGFFATPSTMRKVINQIAGANQHFCIIRQLHVRNEKDKGPRREGTNETSAPTIAAPKATPASALNFIVGNEKLETTAKIEIVKFTF